MNLFRIQITKSLPGLPINNLNKSHRKSRSKSDGASRPGAEGSSGLVSVSSDDEEIDFDSDTSASTRTKIIKYQQLVRKDSSKRNFENLSPDNSIKAPKSKGHRSSVSITAT